MTQAPSVNDTGAPEAADDRPETDAADVEVADVQLDDVPEHREGGGGGQIDVLLDTRVEVAARLGAVRMPVRDLLELGPGSVVRLDTAAGEPIDLLLNGLCFAKGDLVAVGDRLAVRIREVLKTGQCLDGTATER